MNIAVIGSGYVGLVSATCFSEMGNRVTCMDLDAERIAGLECGRIPIYEPGLETLVKGNSGNGNLVFTTSIMTAIAGADVCFIAVGTPMGDDGNADLSQVLACAKSIGQAMQGKLVVVDKSTVPVGTAETVRGIIDAELSSRGLSLPLAVVSNPEFLKEGAAIKDFMSPDRIIIGTDDQDAYELMRELYRPFTLNHERIIRMDVKSAEMTKYAANAMLATKISFINEMANICGLIGADVNMVRVGIGSDTRIGFDFLYPGCGYGGSCFPKDIKSLEFIARSGGYEPLMLSAVQKVNEAQKRIIGNKIVARYGENLSGFEFGIWGLSFKPETDDMRDAPSLTVIADLVERGARLNVYDPKAMEEARLRHLSHLDSIRYCQTKYETLKGMDALILLTEWKEFRSPDFPEIKQLLKTPVVFDGRNQYDPRRMEEVGLEYYRI